MESLKSQGNRKTFLSQWIKSLALLSLFLLPNNTSHSHFDEQPALLNEQLNYKTSQSHILSHTPILHKSVLYYHIARNEQWVFDVCERSERVIKLTDRISVAGRSVHMPDDIIEQFRWLIFSESWWDSLATSSVDAKWVAQIMKMTAKDFGWYWSKNHRSYDKRIDIDRSLHTAAKILNFEYQSFGDWSLAFAAYHLGHGNMRKLRALYKETMWHDLCSMDQLYAEVPSPEVIDWLASKNDDTFGYLAKIYNAVTLLRLYEQDPQYFDYLESQYQDLPYDLRWIVAENIAFKQPDYFSGSKDVAQAIDRQLLVALDHHWFVCGNYSFENFLQQDAKDIIDVIEQMYGTRPRIDCGFIDQETIGDTFRRVNGKQILRLWSHATGRTFDLHAPKNHYDPKKKRIVWWSDYNRLEYVLTLLRYQGKIVWCRETDVDRKMVQHFHVTVLPPTE